MSFSTNTLRGALEGHSGPAYTNRWKLTLPPRSGSRPGGGTTQGGDNPTDVALLCTQVALPSKTLTTLDRQIGLEPIKVASGYTFGPVSMTFYLTQDYLARKYWQAWMDMCVNPTPPYTVGYRNNYIDDITIEAQDKLGATKYTVVLENAYPVTINEIEFNNQAAAAVGELTVTVEYSNYTVS